MCPAKDQMQAERTLLHQLTVPMRISGHTAFMDTLSDILGVLTFCSKMLKFEIDTGAEVSAISVTESI